MPLSSNDLLIVERGGVQYQMTADDVADFVRAVREFSAADITARDALTDLVVGDRVFVADASADATVDSGWAIYRVDSTGPNVFFKQAEQEGLDITVSAGDVDLSYTPAANQGTINNTGGNNVVLPVVDGTNAGLATPTMFNNTHGAASSTGTSATNPVGVNGSQQISFSISALSALP